MAERAELPMKRKAWEVEETSTVSTEKKQWPTDSQISNWIQSIFLLVTDMKCALVLGGIHGPKRNNLSITNLRVSCPNAQLTVTDVLNGLTSIQFTVLTSNHGFKSLRKVIAAALVVSMIQRPILATDTK